MENKEFIVHDRLGPVTVTGRLLADQRFGSDRKPRWTDMALYQVVETLHYWRLAVSCGGCSPPRTLLASPEQASGAPIICGACEKPFAPDEKQLDEPFRYALEIIARSWVYHRFGSKCMKPRHKIQSVGNVKQSDGRWGNLFPCPRCEPGDLEELNDDDRICEEQPDTHVYLCSTALAVIDRMYRHSGEISQLAARMLQLAGRDDPEIRSALRVRHRRV